MQYSPKLKKAMEEIKAIVKKYDVACHCVLHTPGFSEYLMEISPTYSCAKKEGDSIRFKAKKDDFNGAAKLRDTQITNTANMMNLLSETMAKNAMALINVSEQFDKIVDADHGDNSHTAHSTQNN